MLCPRTCDTVELNCGTAGWCPRVAYHWYGEPPQWNWDPETSTLLPSLGELQATLTFSFKDTDPSSRSHFYTLKHKHSSLNFFQPFPNVKNILWSQTVENQAVGWCGLWVAVYQSMVYSPSASLSHYLAVCSPASGWIRVSPFNMCKTRLIIESTSYSSYGSIKLVNTFKAPRIMHST